MFNTDSFIAAEVAYRRQKVTKDWRAVRRSRADARTNAATSTER